MLRLRYFVFVKTFSLFLFISVICSRYDFLLFENFENNKLIFHREMEIVKSLTLNRKILGAEIDALNCRISSNVRVKTILDTDLEIKTKFHHLLDFELKMISNSLQSSTLSYLNIYTRHYRKQRKTNIDFSPYAYNNTLDKIMASALKGLIMLQETYNQDIKQFSEGTLRLKNGIDKNDRYIDSLQVDDLASMSTVAFHFYKYYDSSLIYVQLSENLLKKLSLKERRNLPENIGEILHSMKKQFLAYHNNLFKNRTNIIGPDWKLFPYLVTIGKHVKFQRPWYLRICYKVLYISIMLVSYEYSLKQD